MSDFKKLRVWIAAQDLADDVNRVADAMEGLSGRTLRDQMVRAALSVPSNIVEGVAHRSRRETARFLRYSSASSSEVEGHVLLSQRLRLISDADATSLIEQVEAVRMMLSGLIKYFDR